jgi:hypothetical protein
MTSPVARPTQRDLMQESLDSVPVSQVPIVDPNAAHYGPPSDLRPIPDSIALDAGNASCVVSGLGPDAGVAAMDMRQARYEDHSDDVAPQGGSEGDLMPLPAVFHATPGPNLPVD